ncbi:hypothetical protein M8C21_017471, partial [Ambrosia artemisiifolia]
RPSDAGSQPPARACLPFIEPKLWKPEMVVIRSSTGELNISTGASNPTTNTSIASTVATPTGYAGLICFQFRFRVQLAFLRIEINGVRDLGYQPLDGLRRRL